LEKTKSNFNNVYLFKDENLYAAEYQIKLKLEALKELISDDEDSIAKIKKKMKT